MVVLILGICGIVLAIVSLTYVSIGIKPFRAMADTIEELVNVYPEVHQGE